MGEKGMARGTRHLLHFLVLIDTQPLEQYVDFDLAGPFKTGRVRGKGSKTFPAHATGLASVDPGGIGHGQGWHGV